MEIGPTFHSHLLLIEIRDSRVDQIYTVGERSLHEGMGAKNQWLMCSAHFVSLQDFSY